MARRLVGSSMAVVLLLAAATAVLSNVPSSALASSGLPSETYTTDSSSEQQQEAPPPPPPSDDDHDKQAEQAEHEMDPEKKKAVEDEKAAQQELLKSAAEKHHLVSPTNGTGSYKGMKKEFLKGHNDLRDRYGVPRLEWDSKLARLARRWSDAMRMKCEMKHSDTHNEYGQSVFVTHNDWNATATEVIKKWCEEEPIYDKVREKCLGGRDFHACGHFALMVKKKAAKVGCARAECFKGGVFVTCNYQASNQKLKKSMS